MRDPVDVLKPAPWIVSETDLKKIELGNALALATTRIILTAFQARAWYVVENGKRIRLWEIPHLIEAFELTNAKFVTTEYCCWGLNAIDGSKAPWQKSTTLAGTLPGLAEIGRRRCRGRRRCEVTGQLHTPLTGRDENGNWRTRVAEP